MKIIEDMSAEAWVVAGVSALLIAIAVFLFLNWLSRMKTVRSDCALAIKTNEGVQRIITSSETLKGVSTLFAESAVKGRRQAKRFEYPRKDHEQDEKRVEESLMNPKSGAISLLVTQMDLPTFTAVSADHHAFKIHTSIRFRLDAERLLRAFEYVRVCEVLMRRAESAVRGEINSRENQEISSDIKEIRGNVKDELLEPEQKDRDQLRRWVRSRTDKTKKDYFDEVTTTNAIGIWVVDVDINVDELDVSGARLGARSADDGLASPESVMDIPTQHLDNIRDTFLPNIQKAREKLARRAAKNRGDLEQAKLTVEQLENEDKKEKDRLSDGEAEATHDDVEAQARRDEDLEKARKHLGLMQWKVEKDQEDLERADTTNIETQVLAYREANFALLEMLEMFTRVNVARASAHARSTLVVPSAEAQSVKNYVYRTLSGTVSDGSRSDQTKAGDKKNVDPVET